jgi:ferric-dicitrate binding protein FerR (iron transport regulator)
VADQIDPRLLDRYVTAECTPAERVVVEAWIAADPRRRELVDGLLAFRARLERQATDHPIDEMEAALMARIARERAPERTADSGVLRFRGPAMRASGGTRVAIGRWPLDSGWSRVAAAAVVGGALALGYGLQMLHGHLSARHTAWREYASAAGERNSVTLADGTQFTLGPESHLRVPVDFAAGHRAVELDGEAFFAVVHDAAHPFSVRAGRVVTVDVGTSFDIRAYAGERAVRIGVAEGEVALMVSQDRRALVAGDLARVDTLGATTVSRGVDSDEFLAWTRGAMVFRGAPLADVMAELSRWYGVTFTAVDPALGDVRLTATYADESLDDVLDQMGRVIGARVTRHGRDITLRSIGTQKSWRPGLSASRRTN